jgi:predicted outer membrane repeat protein
MNNYALDGAGIMALDGDPVIRNCSFIDNEADYGGAMFYNNHARPIISGSYFFGNHAVRSGGAVYAETDASITVTNCTISHNASYSGGGIEIRAADIEMINTIISFSGDGEALAVRGTPRIIIEYSDIFGNAGGDWIGPIENLLGQDGNISADPLFVDTLNNDCHLSENSPCIDAGDPMSPYDPDGTIADIGAFYYEQMVDVDFESPGPPISIKLSPNYPNPFNARTTINYSLPQPSDVRLDIYDILGRRVHTLFDGRQTAGEHSIIWETDRFSSGIYFYNLTAGGINQTRKMLLAK